MSAIEFRTLGALDLRAADGRELFSLLAQPKRIALLAYLCIAEPRGYHRRDTLLGLFWPDSDQEHARTSLRKSLHVLRRTLGDNTIVSRGDEEVAVDRDLITSDVVSFDELIRENRLQEALDLYRGDFLVGFFVDEAPEFERWLQAERTRLRAAASRIAYTLAEALEKKGDLPGAVNLAQRSFELADTDERKLRKLMSLQFKAGDRAGSIETYDAFARSLAAEYQTQPGPETQSLVAEIRAASEGIAPVSTPALRTLGETDTRPAAEEGTREPIMIRPRRTRRSRILALTALAAVFLGATTWNVFRPSSNQVIRYTLDVDRAEPLAQPMPWTSRIAISPDGSVLVYTSHSPNGPDQAVLRVRKRNELHAAAIAGATDPATPFFSPDGKNIGFLREKSIWIADNNGGPPIHVSDSLNGVAGASWGSDGFIYTDGSGIEPLVRVEAKAGAVPKWFTKIDTASGEIDHAWPFVLPNGKGVLFSIVTQDKYRIDRPLNYSIAVAEIPSGKYRVIIKDGSFPVYVQPGYMLYVTPKQTLMMVPFDQSSMTVTGRPTVLIEGMRFTDFGATDLAVSQNGTLVYSLGLGLMRNETELLWISRDGKRQEIDPDWHGLIFQPTLSPDNKRLAVSKSLDGHSGHVWIKELDRGPAYKLTPDKPESGSGIWTPDGKAVTFYAPLPNGQPALWTKRADGSGDPVRLFPDLPSIDRWLWSPDGKWFIFALYDKDEESDIAGVRPGIDTAPVIFVKGNFMEWGPDISPDGNWLAYQSDETGLYQIYVVPFPDTKLGKRVVTTAGGIWPQWGPRGDELFYRDTSGDITVMPVKTKPTFSSGTPKKLFEAKRAEFPLGPYGISRDDQRLLMVRLLHHNATDKIVVVENWFEELKKKAAK